MTIIKYNTNNKTLINNKTKNSKLMNTTVSILKKISFVLIMLVLTKVGYSASFTAVSSGDFSNNATWAGSVAPASLVLIDQIFIPVGIDVNLDNDLSINALAAQLDVNGTLTTNNNSLLTINAGVLSGTGSIVVNTLSINVSPLLSFTGDITANTLNSTTGFQSAATIAVVQVLNLTVGTLSLVSGGSLTMISNGTITVAGGLLSVGVGGALDLSNSYNVNYTSGTVLAGVELNGTGLQTVTINVGAGNTVTLTDDLTVPGTLSLTSGTLVLNGNDLAINGAVAATGAGTVLSTALSNISINTSTGNVGSLNFSGFTSTVNSLTVNVANGNEAAIGGNLTVAGPLQLNSGTLNFSNTNLTLNGGITGTGTLSGNLSSNLTISSTAITATSLNFITAGQSIGNLTLAVGSGNTVLLLSNLTVNGTLSIPVGNTFSLNGNTLTLSNTSNFSGIGFIAVDAASTLIINTTAGIASLNILGTIGGLTVNTGSNNVVLNNNLTVDGVLNLQSGSLVLNNNDLTLNGNVAAAGTGTISSTATSDITLSPNFSTTSAISFASGANTVGTLTIDVAGSGVVAIGSLLNVNETLQFLSGKLDIGSNTLVMLPGSIIPGAGGSTYVVTAAGGSLARTLTAGGSNAVNFPVGNVFSYAPASIFLNAASNEGEIRVGVASNVLAQGTSGNDLSVDQPAVDATWNITSNITSGLDMNAQLAWSTSMEVNSFNRSAAYVSHYINGGWDVDATTSATTDNEGMHSISRNNITALSPFAVFDENASTPVIEKNNLVNFVVYPNPATDNIVIQNTIAYTAPLNAAIFNATGQLIGSYILTESMTTVSLNNLISGHYFIKFYNNEINSTQALIKM
jgi:hypothetical protein